MKELFKKTTDNFTHLPENINKLKIMYQNSKTIESKNMLKMTIKAKEQLLFLLTEKEENRLEYLKTFDEKFKIKCNNLERKIDNLRYAARCDLHIEI